MPSREMVFGTGPQIVRSRSAIDLSHSRTQTMNAGYLYPCLCYTDVLPGDTFKLGMSMVVRSTTPITAVMDDSYIQCEFWWVPNTLVLSRASMSPALNDSNHSWKSFMGAQDYLLNIGVDTHIEQRLPSLPYNGSSNGTSVASYRGNLAHYLKYPYLSASFQSVSAAANSAGVDMPIFNPFAMLAFYQVWGDAYREPNLWNPVTYSISNVNNYDFVIFTSNLNAGINASYDIFANGFPKICREHGYFGSLLPWPQRNAVGVSLSLAEFAPLTTDKMHLFSEYDNGNHDSIMYKSYGALNLGSQHLLAATQTTTDTRLLDLGIQASDRGTVESVTKITGTNLVADLRNVTGFTINAFRYNLALQAYFEALSRLGNRYDDVIYNYGVRTSKPCCDRSEYLGGKRIPLNMVQVAASADTTGKALGDIGGFSNTADKDFYFTKSFDDFGTIVGVCFIRHHDKWGNGLSRERSRATRLDYYLPQFARIGEVECFRNENWVNFDSSYALAGVIPDFIDGTVLGFMEYGSDYRYHEDECYGEVNVSVGGSKSYWIYQTDWTDFVGDVGDLDLGLLLDGSKQVTEFDATLNVPSTTSGFQFVVQFFYDITAIRLVGYDSIPATLGAR